MARLGTRGATAQAMGSYPATGLVPFPAFQMLAAWGEVTPENLGKAIAELEKQMFRHAELLEFEEAARVRDRIGKLKAQVLKAPGMP
mgnify:CR=1 FL=1